MKNCDWVEIDYSRSVVVNHPSDILQLIVLFVFTPVSNRDFSYNNIECVPTNFFERFTRLMGLWVVRSAFPFFHWSTLIDNSWFLSKLIFKLWAFIVEIVYIYVCLPACICMCTRICALIAHAGFDFEVTSYLAALELDCAYILSIRIERPIKVDTHIYQLISVYVHFNRYIWTDNGICQSNRQNTDLNWLIPVSTDVSTIYLCIWYQPCIEWLTALLYTSRYFKFRCRRRVTFNVFSCYVYRHVFRHW